MRVFSFGHAGSMHTTKLCVRTFACGYARNNIYIFIVARLRLSAAFHTVDNIQYIGYYRLNSVILRL